MSGQPKLVFPTFILSLSPYLYIQPFDFRSQLGYIYFNKKYKTNGGNYVL